MEFIDLEQQEKQHLFIGVPEFFLARKVRKDDFLTHRNVANSLNLGDKGCEVDYFF